MTSNIEIPPENKMTVYYDGACPKCVRDRETYEKLSGSSADQVCWFDITGQDKQLRELGIDPRIALSELHVRQPNGWIVSELDAYILLMSKVPLLKPVT
jgi:predicted DCC family thiol-disulfide oxidoreductase YuxK